MQEILLKYLNYTNGFYIEAGANDGVSQSNTLYLEKNLNWKGLLIEPNPHKFANISNNRSIQSNILVNCALDSDPNKKFLVGNFSESESGESLMSCVSEIKEYFSDHIKSEIAKKIKQRPQVSVPCRTLDSILIENGIESIDFFSLDVENYELEVLKGLSFKPKYILVEATEINYENSIKSLLINKGYKLIERMENNNLYKLS